MGQIDLNASERLRTSVQRRGWQDRLLPRRTTVDQARRFPQAPDRQGPGAAPKPDWASRTPAGPRMVFL